MTICVDIIFWYDWGIKCHWQILGRTPICPDFVFASYGLWAPWGGHKLVNIFKRWSINYDAILSWERVFAQMIWEEYMFEKDGDWVEDTNVASPILFSARFHHLGWTDSREMMLPTFQHYDWGKLPFDTHVYLEPWVFSVMNFSTSPVAHASWHRSYCESIALMWLSSERMHLGFSIGWGWQLWEEGRGWTLEFT